MLNGKQSTELRTVKFKATTTTWCWKIHRGSIPLICGIWRLLWWYDHVKKSNLDRCCFVCHFVIFICPCRGFFLKIVKVKWNPHARYGEFHFRIMYGSIFYLWQWILFISKCLCFVDDRKMGSFMTQYWPLWDCLTFRRQTKDHLRRRSMMWSNVNSVTDVS